MAKQRDGIIKAIGALKLLKGLLLVAVGACALSWMHQDAASHVASWITALGFDPEHHYLSGGLEKLERANPHELRELGAASLIYAAMFITEGIGLLLRRVWAEYLTVIITTSFIPLEIYEMVKDQSWAKAIIIALNVAIVCYLVLRLRRDNHWPFKR